MKYCLIVGYQIWETYKDFPTIRIHINDQLVDEFICDNAESREITMDTSYYETVGGDLRQVKRDRTETLKFTVPIKYKIYDVDSTNWPDLGKLVLEVINNKSDYDNGFMKKRSIVGFDPVFLIRKDLLEDPITLRRIFEKHLSNDVHFTMTWGRSWPENRLRHRWPGISGYPGREILFKRDPTLYGGGNQKFEIAIKKKYRMFMLCAKQWRNKGFLSIDRYFIAWYQHFANKIFDYKAFATLDERGDVIKVTAEVQEKQNKYLHENQ